MGGSKVGWVGLVQNTPPPLINEAWNWCLCVKLRKHPQALKPQAKGLCSPPPPLSLSPENSKLFLKNFGNFLEIFCRPSHWACTTTCVFRGAQSSRYWRARLHPDFLGLLIFTPNNMVFAQPPTPPPSRWTRHRAVKQGKSRGLRWHNVPREGKGK